MPILFIPMVILFFFMMWLLSVGFYRPIGALFNYIVNAFKEGIHEEDE